jgi:hypothetical protein
LPGASVAAGGASTDGENLLPSVGLSTFSVGVAEGLLDGVVEVVVVVVGGAWFSLLLHDATNEAMVISAAPPTTAAMRVLTEGEFMRFLFRSGELALAGGLR